VGEPRAKTISRLLQRRAEIAGQIENTQDKLRQLVIDLDIASRSLWQSTNAVRKASSAKPWTVIMRSICGAFAPIEVSSETHVSAHVLATAANRLRRTCPDGNCKEIPG
jgi:hypothetical protein